MCSNLIDFRISNVYIFDDDDAHSKFKKKKKVFTLLVIGQAIRVA